jgi:tetratricopeptide (TPR) repeat protein
MQYYPPRRPGISEEDFRLYSGVVAGVYRLHDQMLGRLLQLAGPETAVLLVSDHGFFSDGRRPPPSNRAVQKNARLWHRRFGVLCLAGPSLKRNEIIHGAGILDIAPTVLTLFGLPVGEDMDGRPLLEAFATRPELIQIPSWEQVPGASGMHPADQKQDPWLADAALRQLAALGYIDPPSDDKETAARSVRRERTFHLALHYLETGRAAEALPVFEELLQEEPANVDFLLYVARCRFKLNQFPACRQTLQEVLRLNANSGHAELLLGQMAFAENQMEEALSHSLKAEQLDPRNPTVQGTLGQTYLRMQKWAPAETAFNKCVNLDPDLAAGYLGLAHTAVAQERFSDAAARARRAAALNPQLGEAFFVLGIALARQGQVTPAFRAFEECLRADERFALAHQWLAVLHEQATGNLNKAAEHRKLAEQLLKGTKAS